MPKKAIDASTAAAPPAKRNRTSTDSKAAGGPAQKAEKAEKPATPVAKGKAKAKAEKAAGSVGGARAAEAGAGGRMTGTVSSWYPGSGITGCQYGFIERTIANKSGPGFIEYHRFELADANFPSKQLAKGLRVSFANCGKDECGRLRATAIQLTAEAKDKLGRTEEVLEERVMKSAAARGAQIAAAPAPADMGQTAMELLTPLVVKVWKKLGPSTMDEITWRISESPKLSAKVEELLGKERKNSGDEVWQELIPRILRNEGDFTQEKRPFNDGPSRKVYRLREDLHE